MNNYLSRLNPDKVLVCLVLTAAVLLIYMPVRHHDFIGYDDTLYVIENHQVQKGLTLESAKWAFTTFKASNWHPVTWLSHMLDVSLFGLDAGKHHMVNVIIHAANAVLLFFVFLRTTYQIWPSFFIAALFSVHPMHVESVAWLSERKDVLSLFIMLVTLLFYISYVKTKSRISYISGVIIYAIGLMAKPMLVTLPFLFLLFDYWPLKRIALTGKLNHPSHDSHEHGSRTFCLKNAAALLIEKIPFFILSTASSIITVIAQNKGGSLASIKALSFSMRFSNSLVSYFEYIKKLFYPVDLFIPYPYPDAVAWSSLLLSAIFLLAVTLLAVLYVTEEPYLITGWLWFAGSLIPVIGIVQVGAQSMADRYVYIPYIGLYVILIFGLYELLGKPFYGRFLTWAVLCIAVICCVYLTVFQVGLWKDTFTVFSHSLAVNDRNLVAHCKVAGVLMYEKKISEAIDHFSKASSIDPGHIIPYIGLGDCNVALNRYQEAERYYLKAIELNPGFESIYFKLGYLYLKSGMYSEASDYLRKAIELNPEYAQAYLAMGVFYYVKNQNDQAVVYFQKAHQLGAKGAMEYLEKLLGK